MTRILNKSANWEWESFLIRAAGTIYLGMIIIRNWKDTIQLVSILHENETHSQQRYMRMIRIRKVSVILQLRIIRI